MAKKVIDRLGSDRRHWVGDGFPVRSLFSYQENGARISPFLLFDYTGPYDFPPTSKRLGVGQHPHRGFETVSIVYDGELEHHDSAGHGGVIGPGDVQWMTAGGGIVHEEYHAPAFGARGGSLRGVQLWVNLPARHKMTDPAYQPITASQIPTMMLPEAAGSARIIAGELSGTKGPANTFTPINVWDVRIDAGKGATLPLPAGHNALIIVMTGAASIDDETFAEAEVAHLDTEGYGVEVWCDIETQLLVLSGEPIDEPIAGYGPFVMNTEVEIKQAIDDFNNGKFVRRAA